MADRRVGAPADDDLARDGDIWLGGGAAVVGGGLAGAGVAGWGWRTGWGRRLEAAAVRAAAASVGVDIEPARLVMARLVIARYCNEPARLGSLY